MDLRICRQSSVQGRQENGGFTDYVFPREGETEPSPKRAYSKAFEPFGWVLGTGNYTDDIDEDVLGVKMNFLPMNPTAEWRSSESLLSWK